MDLKELYENETGKDPWFQNEVNGSYGLTQDYVEWLEEKINRKSCKSDSDKLIAFSDWVFEQPLHLGGNERELVNKYLQRY